MDINADLLQWSLIFFDEKTSGSKTSAMLSNKFACSAVKSEIMSKKELAEEWFKTVIRKIEKRKVHLSIIDNIRGADLADMQLINKFNKRFCFCNAFLMFSVNRHGLFF